MLRVEDVSVRFGGVKAVAGMSLDAPSGRITGLIGPNGAGKTTLFNVITGLQKPGTGRVLLDERDLTKASTAKRARAGMGRTFQRLEVFGSLTVHENVQLAGELARVKNPSATADLLLERVGLASLAKQHAGVLPTGMARLLELARALAGNPSVLLLDEPGSGLTETECTALGDLLLSLAAEGTAVLLVEHDMELVMRVCQHVYVMDFGELLASGSPVEVSASRAVQVAYLGAEEVAV